MRRDTAKDPKGGESRESSHTGPHSAHPAGVKPDQLAAAVRPLPGHLVALPESPWALWRWVGLRGAGFPVARLLDLADPECATSADRLNAAEDRAERLWQAALDIVRQEIDAAEPERRKLLYPALRTLKKGRAPGEGAALGASQSAIRQFTEALREIERAQAEFDESSARAITRASHSITEVMRDCRFQEALAWQNRRAFHIAAAQLLEKTPPNSEERNQHLRQSQELVASYWQRYCAKNDTIGFFGPIGWARIDSRVAAIDAHPGSELLAERNVYFDAWCIDALAQKLADDDRLRPWLAPHLSPTYFIEGKKLYPPFKSPVELSNAEQTLIEACDGSRTAREIALDIVERRIEGLENEEKVYQLLDELKDRNTLHWTLAVPWNAPLAFQWRAETILRSLLDRIGDDGLRRRCVGALQELEQGRQEIVRAASDIARLNAAFDSLETTFTLLTGLAPTRADGKMYAGRTLVYEDCRRDAEVEIGAELINALSRPLSLILESARWYTCEISTAYRRAFAEIYDCLARERKGSAVDFLSFWTQAQPLIFGDKRGLIRTALQKLQTRWGQILSPNSADACLRYTCDEIQFKVKTAFEAPGPAWNSARYSSPDVMIAASSVEAIRQGDYYLVLGEFHVGTNTLNHLVFVAQHPSPQDLLSSFASDQHGPSIIPVAPKYMITQRTYAVFDSPQDYRLEFSPDPSGITSAQSIPIGSLVIEQSEDGLIVSSRDGRLRFDALEVFGSVFSEKIANHFRLLPPCGYTPRIMIDRLVINRQSWQFPAADLEFAHEKSESLRFLAVRRWAKLQHLPRFVFFKSPVEVKPCFLDFENIISTNIFAKVIRRTLASALTKGTESADQMISVSEMLPTPDQVWLPDAQGERYTSELRIVAIDRL